MTNVYSINQLNNIAATSQTRQQNKAAGASEFDMLLSGMNNLPTSNDIAAGLLNKNLPITGSPEDSSPFGFTSAFESTFGLTGPLPAFIKMVTSKLGLSAEQNKALQDIAVNNKDITSTPENIKKIGAELRAAGIG